MKRNTIILLVVLGILILWFIVTRNGMANSQVEIKGKWGSVQTQYNRKAKMYENILNTIKGAARNEDTTLIKIVQMRSKVPSIGLNASPESLVNADKELNSIGRAALSVNIEAYPQLKATGLYENLQAQVEGTENRVTTALNDWNVAITDYNKKIVSFPNNIIASLLGYQSMNNYEAPVGAEDTKVDFSK